VAQSAIPSGPNAAASANHRPRLGPGTVASVQPGFDHRPALNYSRQSIDILLKQARIDRVTVGGRPTRAPRPRPPAPPDTTAERDST
jgi:hypothetical protein